MQTPTYFSLHFAANPDLLNLIRTFTSGFLEPVLGGGPLSSRVSLATHELLENAVQHASGGATTLRVSVAPLGRWALVTICTRNEAAVTDIGRLKRAVEQLGVEDPGFAYAKALERGDAGIGLARIRAEAELDIECEIHGDEVEVRATARIDTEMGEQEVPEEDR